MRNSDSLDPAQRRSVVMAVVALLVCLSVSIGCSSASRSASDGVVGSYFQNPDRVWAAIQEILVDLEYDVAESNRPDGTLRTEPRADGDGIEIVLVIDQVMYTFDQVKVYIKAADGDGETHASPAQLEAAAKEFLALLNKSLGG